VEHALLWLTVLAAGIPRPAPGTAAIYYRRTFKRLLDLGAAIVGLFLALPIFIVVPVLIKLDSPGPVFYRQTRVGMNRRRSDRRVLRSAFSAERRSEERRSSDNRGQLFSVLKFRSMVQNAERTCGPVWAIENDPRITRLGRFLRRSRIDEVPQLINVLMGQMSLIGPRPERPHFVSRFSGSVDRYEHRLRIKPGITGLAQVENGYDRDELTVYRKVEYDLHYIRNWSVLLDLRILWRTVGIVLSGWGAK
jgi:lipopolysaccharide/colanic/teichoic acid biosynthesis glycosyltransferase